MVVALVALMTVGMNALFNLEAKGYFRDRIGVVDTATPSRIQLTR